VPESRRRDREPDEIANHISRDKRANAHKAMRHDARDQRRDTGPGVATTAI